MRNSYFVLLYCVGSLGVSRVEAPPFTVTGAVPSTELRITIAPVGDTSQSSSNIVQVQVKMENLTDHDLKWSAGGGAACDSYLIPPGFQVLTHPLEVLEKELYHKKAGADAPLIMISDRVITLHPGKGRTFTIEFNRESILSAAKYPCIVAVPLDKNATPVDAFSEKMDLNAVLHLQ